MIYFIYSKKHSRGEAVWWQANRAGYTTDLKRAGEYTQEDANLITSGHRGDSIAMTKDDAHRLYAKEVVDLGWGENAATFESLTGEKP